MGKKKENPKVEIKKSIESLSEVIDLNAVNKSLKDMDITKVEVSKKTLMNIASWILDGKSETEIRNNLELTFNEWAYLLKTCPAIVFVMQHASAYADLVVGGTLFQTAIGGKIIKRKVPVKIKEYDFNPETGKSWVVGEHWETMEVEEETQPNPMLLKYIAEHKLSEQFGDGKKGKSEEHRKVIDNMSEEERKLFEAEYGDK